MKRACLFLLAGLYAPQLSSFDSHYDLIPLAAFALVGAAAVGRLLPALLVIAGYVLFVSSATRLADERIAPQFVGDSIVTVVRIADFPHVRGPVVSFAAEVGDNAWVPRRIRVSWFEPGQVPRLGEIWQLELRLRRPRGAANPGGFDYEGWLFREGIAATGYVVASHRNRVLERRLPGNVDALRQRVVDRLLHSGIPGDTAAVFAAISVGARHLLSQEQWDRYARTGTSHLMAISGLHVGMVAASGYLLGMVFAALAMRRGNHHRPALLIGLGCALAYAVLAGMAVPAQRAVLMLGIAAVAVLARRVPQPAAVLAASAIVVAAGAPATTLAPGFQLSFAAVAVLFWFAQRLAPGQGAAGLKRLATRVRQLGVMQVLLLLGLMPLTALLFGRVSVAAPFVNLVAVPVFAVAVVPFTLAGLLLDGPLQRAGDALLQVAAGGLGIIEAAIAAADALPAAAMTVADLRGWRCLWLLGPLAWVVLPPGWPGRAAAWLAAAVVVTWTPPRPATGCADVSVLDVGQGLAVSVVTRSSTLLYDTGPSYRGGGDAVQTAVLPFLAARGIGDLDVLVVSHADLDHAGGVSSLLAAVPVRRVIAGDGAAAPAPPCRAGDAWEADGVRFEFLHPSAGAGAEGNDASCVLRVSAGRHALLLPGDIERDAERELLRRGQLRPADVVVAPHHGSATSSGAAFVAALTPSLVIVASGFGNRWGLPDPDVVDRWQRAGSEVVNTATSGAIEFRLCADGVGPVTRERERRRRIWHE